MSKLIKNELIKIFSKKSMIVIGVIILVIIIGFNVLNKISQNMSNSYSAYSESYIQYLDEELAELDPNKPSDINKYVETKSQKDLATLAKDYKETSWQAEVIGTVISPIIEEMNNYEYIDKNNEALTSSKAKYDEMLTALKNNDWKYFAYKELDSLNTQIEELNALIAQDSENDDLKTQLKSLELQKEVVNLRLDKNINYGSDNYKSIAVQNYRMYMGNYIQSSQGKNLTDEEKNIQAQIDEYNRQFAEVNAEILKLALEGLDTQYIGGVFAWPTPGYTRITSKYGMRTHPITGVYKLHTGVDIGAPMGASFVAANDGVVVKAGYNGAYGNMVIIDHGGGIQTLYAHGSEIMVNVGDVVKKGETVVLKVGSTGYSTGAHAHFEVRINGQTVDPIPYITNGVVPSNDTSNTKKN